MQAASQAYKAAREAAAGIVSGGRGAARSAQGAAKVASDIGSRAAGSAQETAGQAYDASKDAANTASVIPELAQHEQLPFGILSRCLPCQREVVVLLQNALQLCAFVPAAPALLLRQHSNRMC